MFPYYWRAHSPSFSATRSALAKHQTDTKPEYVCARVRVVQFFLFCFESQPSQNVPPGTH